MTNQQASTMPPPGWHPDPNDPSQWRWWDGEQWTEQRSPRDGGQQAKKPDNNTAFAGFIFSAILPIIGFLIGLALIARGDRNGIRVVGASIAFGFLWYLVATGQV